VVEPGRQGVVPVRQQGKVLGTGSHFVRLHDARQQVEPVVGAGDPDNRCLFRWQSPGRVEGLSPALSLDRGGPLLAVPVLAVPPGVAELQIARPVEGYSDLQPRIYADHQGREKSTPGAAGYADPLFINLRPGFEIRDG